MNKLNPVAILSLILLFALPACMCTPTGALTGPPGPTPTSAPLPTVATNAKDYTIVRIHKSDGALPALLKAQAGKAQAEKRRPFVEFDATWCPPCQAIKQTLADGDPRMVDAFAGTYIIQVDIDEWANDLAGAGYDVPGIPLYHELDKDGKSTGRKIDGGAWGDNIAENMAPPLKAFFQAGK